MTSQINTQVATVERMVVPTGSGMVNNVSPSIPPIFGSLAVDPTNDSNLYMGDGTVWRNVSGGVRNVQSYTASNISLSLAGQPTLTNCTINIQEFTTGASGNVKQVILSLAVNRSITTTSAGDWASAAGVIPLAYRPASALYFPCTIFTAGGIVNSYFEINSSGTGSIIVRSSAASGLVGFYVLSCVYNI